MSLRFRYFFLSQILNFRMYQRFGLLFLKKYECPYDFDNFWLQMVSALLWSSVCVCLCLSASVCVCLYGLLEASETRYSAQSEKLFEIHQNNPFWQWFVASN